MSKTIQITSPAQFSNLLQSSTIVVADFYADWCGPCKTIAPLYEQLSAQLSRPNKISFTKINTDQQKEITQTYNISAMPTFLIFKASREVHRVRGADPSKLSDAVKKLAAEAESAGSVSSSGGGGAAWYGAAMARGYTDVTDQVDIRGLDALNADTDFATVRTLFETSRPSSLGSSGKGKGKVEAGKKDWVETDTDEQLMLYIPFQSTLKVHSLQITSLPSAEQEDGEVPMRPQQLKLFTNRAHNLGFDEAEDTQATQVVELKNEDWNQESGTANIGLRFVKFQNITSLVVFVVKGDGDGEKCRIDRIRLVGESGLKRDLGKLEKVGDEQGE